MSRPAALHILSTLRQNGHVALLAGGCVRDRLLGQDPKDYDVATDAPPERVRSLFKRTRAVGEAFGVVLVDLKLDGERSSTEVATFRTEGVYSDGRRPDAVEYSDAKHDAQRRDFTVNGLFEDPDKQHPDADAEGIIDYVGGRADLEAKVIRAVGDPDQRFGEDYLRMLRAVRFAARLGFDLDPVTANAVSTHAPKIASIARERIGDEIRRTLTGPRPADAAAMLDRLGLADAVFGAVARETDTARLAVLDTRATFPTRLQTWLSGRTPSVRPHDARAALALSNEETQVLLQLHRFAEMGFVWPDLSTAQRKRRLSEPDFEQACMMWNAGWSIPEQSRAIQQQAHALATDGIGLAPEPFVTGGDLIAQGLLPGPDFKRRLDAAYDAQLDGTAMNKDQARVIALR